MPLNIFSSIFHYVKSIYVKLYILEKHFLRIVHADEFDFFDHLDIGESSYPWEIFHNRPVMDLAQNEFKTGRALVLYPGGYGATEEEAKFINGGRLVG